MTASRSVAPLALRITVLVTCLAVQNGSARHHHRQSRAARDSAGPRRAVIVVQWVVDAYNVVYVSFILSGEVLGDLFGRKRWFLVGVGIVTVGLLACVLAPSGGFLIATRALTGIGGALTLVRSREHQLEDRDGRDLPRAAHVA